MSQILFDEPYQRRPQAIERKVFTPAHECRENGSRAVDGQSHAPVIGIDVSEQVTARNHLVLRQQRTVVVRIDLAQAPVPAAQQRRHIVRPRKRDHRVVAWRSRQRVMRQPALANVRPEAFQRAAVLRVAVPAGQRAQHRHLVGAGLIGQHGSADRPGHAHDRSNACAETRIFDQCLEDVDDALGVSDQQQWSRIRTPVGSQGITDETRVVRAARQPVDLQLGHIVTLSLQMPRRQLLCVEQALQAVPTEPEHYDDAQCSRGVCRRGCGFIGFAADTHQPA